MTRILSPCLVFAFAAMSVAMTERPTLPKEFLIEQPECTAECPCEKPNEPDIRVALLGRTATGGDKTYVSLGDPVDLIHPQHTAFIGDIGTQIGVGTQGGVQRLVLEFEPIVVIPSGSQAAVEPPPVWRRLYDLLAGPVLHAQTVRDTLMVMLTSNGNSQGQAFDLKLINR